MLQNHLYQAWMTLAFGILITSRGDAAEVANGIVFIRNSGSGSDAGTTGALYVNLAKGNPLTKLNLGGGRSLEVETVRLAIDLPFNQIFSRDLVSVDDVKSHKVLIEQLETNKTRFPMAKAHVEPAIESVKLQLNRLESGEVRFRGAWVARSEFEIMTSEAKGNTSRAADDVSTRLSNISKIHPNDSAQFLIQKYQVIKKVLGGKLVGVQSARDRFGTLSASLKQASLPITRFKDDLDPRLYATEEKDGPAVIWVVKEKDESIVAVAAACAISVNRVSGEIQSGGQYERFCKFLGTYAVGSEDTVPSAIIAARVRSVLDANLPPEKRTATDYNPPSMSFSGKTAYYLVDPDSVSGPDVAVIRVIILVL
jgi:hypothetical protein